MRTRGQVFLSGPEVMLIHSLYQEYADEEVVCDDWDRLAELPAAPGCNRLAWKPCRYYKDEDQIRLDFSMARLGDIGGLMVAAKLRASLPRLLHPHVHWSHLQRLLVNQTQLGTGGFMALVDALHVIKALPRLSRLEAADNRIGTAGVQLLCETLKTIPPEPELAEKIGDDEYQTRPYALDRLHRLNLCGNPLTDGALLALSDAASVGALAEFAHGECPYLGLRPGTNFSEQALLEFRQKWAELFVRSCQPYFGHPLVGGGLG